MIIHYTITSQSGESKLVENRFFIRSFGNLNSSCYFAVSIIPEWRGQGIIDPAVFHNAALNPVPGIMQGVQVQPLYPEYLWTYIIPLGTKYHKHQDS